MKKMKKIIHTIAAILLTIAVFVTCDKKPEVPGSIFGSITDKASGEPMRASGVELFTSYGVLVTRTVTGNEGQFEFKEISAGYYYLAVTISGYEDIRFPVQVRAGIASRADMQLERLNTHMNVQVYFEEGFRRIFGNSAILWGFAECLSECSIVDWGFYHATHSNPASGGTRVRATTVSPPFFSANISGLTRGTLYVQAYARNSIGIEYSDVISFEVVGSPDVTTLAVSNLTQNSATFNGRIDFQGDPPFIERGFAYTESQNPLHWHWQAFGDANRVVVPGINPNFSQNISDLVPGKIYRVRAYARNAEWRFWGNVVVFRIDDGLDFIVLEHENIMVQRSDINVGTNWNTANNLCNASTVGGVTGWRLPTMEELGSLASPYYAQAIGLQEGYYWSGTGNGVLYWASLNDGTMWNGSWFPNSNSFRVRCVRTLP